MRTRRPTAELAIIEELTELDVHQAPELKRLGWRGAGWYYWDVQLERCHGPFHDPEACEQEYRRACAEQSGLRPCEHGQ